MALFASPDFGASGIIVCVLFVVGLAVAVLALVGVLRAYQLVSRRTPAGRRKGTLLLLGCAAVPFLCYFAPRQVFRLFHGRYPLDHYPSGGIPHGTTADEVAAKIGPPHQRTTWRDGEESWYYWLDAFAINYFSVHFGPDGRVN